MKLSELKINDKNPFPAEDISSLVEKIEKYPKFLELRPIVYDPATMVILGGNKRYAALKQLGHKEIPEEWVKSADQLTEKEKRAFIFADNYNIGTWDFEVIDDGEAMEWDIEMGTISDPIFTAGESNSDVSYEYPDEDLMVSHVRMVQLFLNTETEPDFREFEQELRKHFNTDNLTDTVFEAVKWAYQNKSKI